MGDEGNAKKIRLYFICLNRAKCLMRMHVMFAGKPADIFPLVHVMCSSGYTALISC